MIPREAPARVMPRPSAAVAAMPAGPLPMGPEPLGVAVFTSTFFPPNSCIDPALNTDATDASSSNVMKLQDKVFTSKCEQQGSSMKSRCNGLRDQARHCFEGLSCCSEPASLMSAAVQPCWWAARCCLPMTTAAEFCTSSATSPAAEHLCLPRLVTSN